MRTQTIGEEIANSVTHGIGALLSLAALVLLIVFSGIHGDAWRIVSLSVYGVTLFFLYLISTLYHSISRERTKRILRILDHTSIYLLIAGTYTPILLVFMRGGWGWALFGIVWAMAIGGILFEIFFLGKFKFLSVMLYIAMGWLIVIAYQPLIEFVSKRFLLWLLVGGVCYTAGLIFYGWKKMPYHHMIWHLFVLGGSAFHFFGLFYYGIPK